MPNRKLIRLVRAAALVAWALTIPFVSAAAVDAGRVPPQPSTGDAVVHGGVAAGAAAKVVTDSLLVMGPWGSGAPYNGQFQNESGAAAWNGWTSVDLTQATESQWHADTYGALSGAWSAWCGSLAYASCGNGDPDGGYGNNWDEVIEWRGAVADPGASCTLDISALLQVDSEPGYDYAWVSVVRAGVRTDLWSADGVFGPATVNLQALYSPFDYEGDGGDEVVLQFRFTSDGGWSDADCQWPTAGAMRLDDLVLTSNNGLAYSHDFEDGSLGELATVLPQGVGDFASLRSGLTVPNACGAQNTTPMVTFVDDGVVVPGTGGTPCITWCYGPGGFIVNTTGGLAGPQEHIHNAVESPVMAWPGPGYEGARLDFDVWRHLLLGNNDPGIFFTWGVRSSADADPSSIAGGEWKSRNFVYYGGPDWARMSPVVGDLIPADAQWVQVQLAVYEIGWVWYFVGSDGTPSPYFDNVRLTAYPYHGPSLSCTVNNLPHDAFPGSGGLDLVNLGANSVRFDTGQDINRYTWVPGPNDPGDSVTIDVKPVRAGATLVGLPRLHWRLQRNPLFDPYRTAGLPDEGSVEGWQVLNNGNPVANRFAFDLPDTGFLFPGDFLYYYFSATDQAGGVVQTATLPADTTGFSDFSDPLAYPPIYKLHALPTVTEVAGAPGTYTQPSVLFWDDAGAEGNRDEWYTAYRNLGLVAGVDYDIYYTNNPRTGSGQGLGGRATAAQVAGYDVMLYTCDKATAFTLSDGDPNDGDRSEDVQLLTAWLQQGGKGLFLTGDDLAGDLNRSGGATYDFLTNWMGVTLVAENVLDAIGGQVAPEVAAVAGAPVLAGVGGWQGVAECPVISNQYYGVGTASTGLRRYDGVVPLPTAVRLAEFLDPQGTAGQYTYSAATLNYRADYDATVISLPYDFRAVWTESDEPAKAAANLAARVRLLQDVLTSFGVAGSAAPSAVPDLGVLAAANHPNPFNPATTISWSLPRAGRLQVDVYDLKGRRVRRLVDGPAVAGPGAARWDGRADDGQAAAAGVYFYRVRAGDQERVGKMALIK